MKKYIYLFWLATCLFLIYNFSLFGQADTLIIGFGSNEPNYITSSDPASNPNSTTNQLGFLPNHNAASRFLAQATMGYDMNDISQVMAMGYEDWLDNQIGTPMPNTLLDQIGAYYAFVESQLGTTDGASSWLFWEYAWWQYHMTSDDYLRQRVAFALSEIWVISENSPIGDRPVALADYYDVLLTHAFGNYRDIMQEITYHACMGVYLTYMKNPKTDLSINQFPDENYARELMQLFTIGLFELNNDGTKKLDGQGNAIPTYDNNDISEFSKVFTGLAWGDSDIFRRYGPMRDSSYILDMQMFNDYHEPGIKYLLNGDSTSTIGPAVDGNSDISEALDNLFNHPNVGPFVVYKLIQRLVTSNPSPAYVDRVATVFNDNGEGERGDMAAVIKAILLDPEATNCGSGDDPNFGMLREPFIRYFQIARAFNGSSLSGNHRNVMWRIEDKISQKPLKSPSVFNFFQQDFQPIGPIEQADLVAPEFQITNSQTISGWLNGLYDWVMEGYIAEAWDIYDGEPDSTYVDEITMLDFSDLALITADDELHILLDRLNLLLAQGRLTQPTLDIIKETVLKFPNNETEEQERRAKLSIYLVLSSPEYLINR